MKPINLKIAAGSAEEIAVVGDYVRVKTASVPVRIEVENGEADDTIEQGDALNLKPFTRLRVSHSDAAEQTIVLQIGNGTSADSSKVGGSIEVSAMPAAAVPVTQTPVVTGADAQVLAANATREFLRLQNTGAVDVFVTYDGSAATAAGIKISPGGSELYDVRLPAGAVRAYSASAGALVVVEG